ncbi:MAG TPA: hypothetical protein VK203_04995 [Nostocaceae cyanobacterium]|nr:hypothetical protein [Nostocaceae cyanobacterium]
MFTKIIFAKGLYRILFLSIGLILCTPESSFAANFIARFLNLDCAYEEIVIETPISLEVGEPKLVPRYNNKGKKVGYDVVRARQIVTQKTKARRLKVDPVAVKSFQLDVSFDPQTFSLVSLDYATPYYEGSTQPDFSQLASGKILDIAGLTDTPSSEPGNIIELTFALLQQPDINNSPVFSLSENDSFTTIDLETGQETILGSNDIPACTVCRSVPEPSSTLGIIALGTIAAVSTIQRKWKLSKLTQKETATAS